MIARETKVEITADVVRLEIPCARYIVIRRIAKDPNILTKRGSRPFKICGTINPIKTPKLTIIPRIDPTPLRPPKIKIRAKNPITAK